ncbi:unnamed protein product [Mycena citricolor]|uniref:Uncharacterized protein n=2 Tax=Mycena citricolor TaxID=2018698 RepID=A0AAD2HIA2_9AGAR|nr:unnamed protein product [Mycena citricolor]CAK5276292.1 unnamed protein product [Mycena citricolor]
MSTFLQFITLVYVSMHNLLHRLLARMGRRTPPGGNAQLDKTEFSAHVRVSQDATAVASASPLSSPSPAELFAAAAAQHTDLPSLPSILISPWTRTSIEQIDAYCINSTEKQHFGTPISDLRDFACNPLSLVSNATQTLNFASENQSELRKERLLTNKAEGKLTRRGITRSRSLGRTRKHFKSIAMPSSVSLLLQSGTRARARSRSRSRRPHLRIQYRRASPLACVTHAVLQGQSLKKLHCHGRSLSSAQPLPSSRVTRHVKRHTAPGLIVVVPPFVSSMSMSNLSHCQVSRMAKAGLEDMFDSLIEHAADTNRALEADDLMFPVCSPTVLEEGRTLKFGMRDSPSSITFVSSISASHSMVLLANASARSLTDLLASFEAMMRSPSWGKLMARAEDIVGRRDAAI